MAAGLPSATLQDGWSVEWWLPPNWWVVPSVDRAGWAMRTAERVAVASGGLAASLLEAASSLPVAQSVLPVVMVDGHPAVLAAWGWLYARDRADRTGFDFDTGSGDVHVPEDSVYCRRTFNIDADDGSRCRIIHSLERASFDDDSVVERVVAVVANTPSGVIQHLCLVTRDLLAFEDLPATAFDVLSRSVVSAAGSR